MSVINQVLLDLERRRASPAERGAVPSHVRALPDSPRATLWTWLAIAGGAALAAVGLFWMMFAGRPVVPLVAPAPQPIARAPQPVAQAPRFVTEAAIENVVVASTGVVPEVRAEPRSEGPVEFGDFRLRLGLSSTPPETAPLATSTVVAGTETVAQARQDKAVPEAPRAGERPRATAPAKSAAGPVRAKPEIHKQVRQPTPKELADNEYRKAATWLQQGRLTEAQEGFRAALDFDPAHHGARQGLVVLLLEGRQRTEAERVLQEGLELAPAQTGFAMTLARLQLDRGDAARAAATLRQGYQYAQGNADYLAFLAALLQRQGRHEEAIEQFQSALRLKPRSGVWWLGLGISLQAVNRTADAREAYGRARATNTLQPELAAFAEQRLNQLQ